MKFENDEKVCYNNKDVTADAEKSQILMEVATMEEYKISYRGSFIGNLFRDTKEKQVRHLFTPSSKIPPNVREQLKMFPELLEASEWIQPIPVLENRIRDARRFGKSKYIANQTDAFQIEKIRLKKYN